MNQKYGVRLTSILSLPAVFFATSAYAADARPLPTFASKTSLLNFAGAVATEDGTGIDLYRLPAEVRAQINEKAQKAMHSSAHSEIRFVLNEGATLKNVKMEVELVDEATQAFVEFFCGDYQYFNFHRTVRRRTTLSPFRPTAPLQPEEIACRVGGIRIMFAE